MRAKDSEERHGCNSSRKKGRLAATRREALWSRAPLRVAAKRPLLSARRASGLSARSAARRSAAPRLESAADAAEYLNIFAGGPFARHADFRRVVDQHLELAAPAARLSIQEPLDRHGAFAV